MIVIDARFNSIAVGLADELFGVVGVERVHHVKEVASVRQATFWKLIWEVDHKLWLVYELGVQILDAQLLEFWHLNYFDFFEGQQLFLLKQNLTQKVFVEHSIRGHVELHYKKLCYLAKFTYASL